jgi:RecA/RadA recombinase
MAAKKPKSTKIANKTKAAEPTAAEESKKKASKPRKSTADDVPDYDPDALQVPIMQPAPDISALAGRLKKSLGDVKERVSKRGVTMLSAADLRKPLLQIPDILLQYAIGSCGIRCQTVSRFIGPPHIGKTSTMAYLAGHFLKQGCGVIWVDLDNKQMDPSRFVRYLGPDRALANQLLSMVMFHQVFNIADVDHTYEVVIPELRKLMDAEPSYKGRPIIVIVDDWSSGKSKSEAAGREAKEAKPGEKKAKKKEVGTAENFGHSKHAAAMRRNIPEVTAKYNACFFLTAAQSEKIDMDARRIPGMPAPSKSDNTTTIGGRALHSLASYQFTLVDAGKVNNKAKAHIGGKVKMRVTKNSYGPKRDCAFQVKFDDLYDTPDTYENPLSFAVATAEFFAKNKILGTKIDSGLVTSAELDVYGVTPDAFYAAFNARPDLVNHVGSSLKIEGYAKNWSTSSVAAATDSSDDEDEEFE